MTYFSQFKLVTVSTVVLHVPSPCIMHAYDEIVRDVVGPEQ